MSISLTPLEDKIIVKQAEAETQTASGLFIPDNAKEKPQQGEVLAVGPGRRNDAGERIPVDVKVGDEGILFGSVTAAMIADAIKDQLGMDIDRKRVELGKPIKVAGAHTVAISLYREIKAEVVVLVGVTAEELAADAEVEEAAEVAEAETAEVETEAAAE